MHRRSASRLVDIASTSSAALGRTTQRHASNVARNRKPPGEALSRKTYDKVELAAKGLVAAAAKKQNKVGWGHPQHHEGETRRLTAAVKSAANPLKAPTPELQMLLAHQNISPDPELGRSLNFEPGSLVEIRRSESVYHGVVVQTIPDNGRWMTYSLLSGGELWPHQDSDVMLYIPGFVERDLIARCGSKQATLLNESEIAARVSVLKRLRNLEIAVEQTVKELHHQLRGIYEQLRHPDPEQATSVTVEEAARLVTSKSRDPLLTKWAVHKYLFEKCKYFSAEVSNFLERPAFEVRSKRDVDTIDAVDEMVARKDPVMDSFVEKAKILIRAARKRARETWSQPPSYQADDNTTFKPAEMFIIRFLCSSLRNNRMTQRDPFLLSQTYIMKKTGLYDSDDYGQRTVYPFLVELGVIPPWQDPVDRTQPSTGISGMPLLGSELARGQPSSSPANTSSTRPASSLPLGPEDFYSRDLVDHLRHDFGDMPVYVIDDADAEELDDGFSVEAVPSEPGRTWLHVHIADPTSVLPPTHRIAREALARMESLYYPDGSIPMLPDVPELRELSLGQVGVQRVMTFSGKIDTEGNIVEYKIRPGIIRNVQKLHYSDVNEAIGAPFVPPQFPFGGGEDLIPPSNAASVGKSAIDDLSSVRKVTDALVKGRVRQGATQYDWTKSKVAIRPKSLPTPPVTNRPYRWSGFPKLYYAVESSRMVDSGSRQIVAECMRLASRIASMWLRDRDIPAIRRVSRELVDTTPGAVQQMLSSRDESGFVDHLLMLQLGLVSTGATYAVMLGPHAVLGIPDGEGYMRATSPLRRFLDMVTHWQIKHALLTPDAPRLFPEEWLQDLAKHSTWWEGHHRGIERNHERFWAYKFLERRIAETKEGSPEAERLADALVAVVTHTPVNNFLHQYWQASCHLWDLGLRGILIQLGPTEPLKGGDRVPVKVAALKLGVTSQLDLVKR
ncbi:uncharacterized protein B0H18DRAFT_1117092 [Fomitopsis serialis]|uniref:uncharacterized protein n=1 Tax=Fomitopsis serialis TaxID=139415 RepID=UPI0020074CB8|nr:uncharacterized protein B0H18DRAFT_1117092 [Neoantrodia serialis]KAH9930021.1 hypothetical protein B0H18DRAFT_1117092 [Neoantrodia serialis]